MTIYKKHQVFHGPFFSTHTFQNSILKTAVIKREKSIVTVKIELNISKLWAILLKDATQYAYYSEKNRHQIHIFHKVK